MLKFESFQRTNTGCQNTTRGAIVKQYYEQNIVIFLITLLFSLY